MDLNADLGELTGAHGARSDAAILQVVTTAHVACGGHAGDVESMRRSAAATLAAGVVLGAHPSYPDRGGFGRNELGRSPAQVRADVLRQLAALAAAAAAEGTVVRSVKPHGALYHRMAVDEACAEAIVRAVLETDPSFVLVAPAGSHALAVAAAAGVRVVAEGFCDRGYLATGTLAARGSAGALIGDPGEAARRAVSIAVSARVDSVDGGQVDLECATLCVHGDTPGAAAVARAVRRALEEAGVAVVPTATAASHGG